MNLETLLLAGQEHISEVYFNCLGCSWTFKTDFEYTVFHSPKYMTACIKNVFFFLYKTVACSAAPVLQI